MQNPHGWPGGALGHAEDLIVDRADFPEQKVDLVMGRTEVAAQGDSRHGTTLPRQRHVFLAIFRARSTALRAESIDRATSTIARCRSSWAFTPGLVSRSFALSRERLRVSPNASSSLRNAVSVS